MRKRILMRNAFTHFPPHKRIKMGQLVNKTPYTHFAAVLRICEETGLSILVRLYTV